MALTLTPTTWAPVEAASSALKADAVEIVTAAKAAMDTPFRVAYPDITIEAQDATETYTRKVDGVEKEGTRWVEAIRRVFDVINVEALKQDVTVRKYVNYAEDGTFGFVVKAVTRQVRNAQADADAA